jgi:hypothetical protein
MEIDQTEERTNCQESTVIEVAVHLSMEEVSLVALHAQNDSYPVFSLQVEQWDLDYRELHDHDEFSIKLGAFRLFDTTNYPNTLDPKRSYGTTEQLLEQEVLSASDPVGERSMLELSLTSFHFPLDHSCPLQAECPNFSSKVHLTVRPIKVTYMQEQFLRLADYFLVQFLESLADTNPYDLMLETLKQECDPFTLTDGMRSERG